MRRKSSAIRAREARSCEPRSAWRPTRGPQIMAEPFEYAIKKDVRNNAVVREIDEARQRELWRWVAVAGFLVAMLLFSAWQQFELLRHGYKVEHMQRERAAEEEMARHLRLEIETLKAPARPRDERGRRVHLRRAVGNRRSRRGGRQALRRVRGLQREGAPGPRRAAPPARHVRLRPPAGLARPGAPHPRARARRHRVHD